MSVLHCTGYCEYGMLDAENFPLKMIQDEVAQQFNIYIVNWKRYRREKNFIAKFWYVAQVDAFIRMEMNFNMICSFDIFYGFQWNICILYTYVKVFNSHQNRIFHDSNEKMMRTEEEEEQEKILSFYCSFKRRSKLIFNFRYVCICMHFSEWILATHNM